MNRLGFIGVRTLDEFLRTLDAERFYAAVEEIPATCSSPVPCKKQVAVDLEPVGFDFDPAQLRAEFDGLRPVGHRQAEARRHGFSCDRSNARLR